MIYAIFNANFNCIGQPFLNSSREYGIARYLYEELGDEDGIKKLDKLMEKYD